MRSLLAALAAALTLVWAPPPAARAQAEAPIPRAAGYVNDVAGVMDEPSRAKLEAFLDQVERKTGAEFAVLTVKTTAPLDPADYKVRVFEAWKLGKRGTDNGLLLLVAVAEHRIAFETGYGLEGTLPDGLEARIIREEMTPRFRAGDVAGGITAGVLRAAARIAAEKGVALEWNGLELRYDSEAARSGDRGVPRVVIALIFFFVIVVMRLVLGGWMGPGAFGGRRGGWYAGMGGWGGGFGGGSFGGGGASFGGFGGGSSGGGGGSGGW